MLADIPGALLADEFFLEYQPQISLLNGHTVGVEALVRWRHPVAGVLTPLEFIGLAEQTELIGPITEWVLRQALTQCESWRREGQDMRMAVNISARNMHDVRFPELVAGLMRETGVNPGAVELEITENTIGLDHSTTHSVLTRLRSSGLSISIDDFGTGYSSMAQLRELPVDRIKIDRSFVTNMSRQDKDALIVRAIVQLGQALGMETIAEGVEDTGVAEMLQVLGCTTAQGWLYGKADATGNARRPPRGRPKAAPRLRPGLEGPGDDPRLCRGPGRAVGRGLWRLPGKPVPVEDQGPPGHRRRPRRPDPHNFGDPEASGRLDGVSATAGFLRPRRLFPGGQNRHIPWLWLLGLGGLSNLAAIGANGGVMPASAVALGAAGRGRPRESS